MIVQPPRQTLVLAQEPTRIALKWLVLAVEKPAHQMVLILLELIVPKNKHAVMASVRKGAASSWKTDAFGYTCRSSSARAFGTTLAETIRADAPPLRVRVNALTPTCIAARRLQMVSSA